MSRSPARTHRAAAIALCSVLAGFVQVDDRPETVQVASSGTSLVWHVPGRGRGLPAADDSSAYFLSTRHEVVAIDAASGVIRWKRNTAGPGDTTLGSALVLAGPVVVAGDYDVAAFDRVSGEPRWRFSPNDGYGPGVYLGATARGLVFTGSPAGRAYAIDEVSGRSRWSALISDDGRTTVFQPIADQDLVVAGYTTFTAPLVGGVVALDAATGRERWRTPFPRPADASLSTGWAGGPLFLEHMVAAVSGDGEVHAFNREDGSIQWTLPAVSAECAAGIGSPDRDFRPLARTGSRLFAGSLTGCVMAYDLDSQRELWQRRSLDEGSTGFSIASDGQTVYVPYAIGELLALDVKSGALRRRVGGRGGFRWPPAIVSGRVYAAASADGFFAFHQ